MLNLFIGTLGEKFPLKLDLTQNKIFELSEETKTVLKNVDRDIDVYYFATKGNEQLYVAQTVEMYKGYTDRIRFEQKDPTADPVFAREIGTDVTDNSIIVRCGDRTKIVDSSTIFDYTFQNQGIIEFQLEQKLTKAIAYVQAEADTNVLFTTGHAEVGITLMKSPLEEENAQVSEINLKTTDIPDNTAAVYVIGPRRDFSADEILKLQSYLANGGALNVSLDVKASDLPVLRQYLSEYWGINYNDDIVMETDSMSILANNPFYILPQIEEHDITNSFVQKKVGIAWPETRSLYLTEKPGVTSAVLLDTTDKAVSKAATESVSFTVQEGDRTGVQTLAAAVSYIDYEKKTRTRIVATGTSLYAAKLLLSDSSVANGDFLRECFLFLKGEDASGISIMPKNVSQNYLVLKQGEITAYTWLFAILPEVLILAAGLVIWLRRRHL